MNKKLFFFDFDNTLFDHKHNEIPKKHVYAIEELKKDHIVVLATGRPYFLVKDYLEQLGIKDCICFNGNVVLLNGEVVFKDVFPKDVLNQLVDFSHDKDVSVLFEGMNEMRASMADDDYMFEYLRKINLTYPQIDENYHLNHDVFQLGMFFHEEHEEEFFKQFPDLNFVRHTKFGMDVLFSEELKDKGMKYVYDYYGISKNDAYAFGDGNNDVGLFREVGVSVAMGNSGDELKACATYVTDDCEHAGIYTFLVKEGLIDA